MDLDISESTITDSVGSRDLPRAMEGSRSSFYYTTWTSVRPFILFVAAYILAYRYASDFSQNSPAPLWFPDSVLLCALLLQPKRKWIWYLLAALPIRLTNLDMPIWFITATYLNDCFKAIFSVYLLRRFIKGSLRLNTLHQFGIYIATVVLAVPALSAIAGAASRLPLGNTFGHGFYQWFLGDAVTALALTPTLLYWCLGGWSELRGRRLKFLGLIVALLASLYVSFLHPHPDYSPIVVYAPVPLLILAATKFKPIGASTAISLLALFSIISAAQGNGVFVSTQYRYGVLSMQLFLFAISIPMLFVAILLEELAVAQKKLNASQRILQDNYQRIQHLAGRLLSAQEDERHKLARELHDDVGQRLSLLCIPLERLIDRVPIEVSEAHAELRDVLGELQSLATDVHDISHQLHSSVLEHMGLEGALRSLCRNVSEQHRIVVNFSPDGVTGIAKETSLCLFRVAQEALNNAVKHGKAKQIELLLKRQNDLLIMQVKDSGTGFDTHLPSPGLGLVSMQERVRYLGGTVGVTSRIGDGTRVNVNLPIGQSA